MTLKEILDYGRDYLTNHQIEDSQIDARYLLEYVCNIDRLYYLMHSEEEVCADTFLLYKKSIEKRARHIPLQHITGEQEFMGLIFKVNEHVLIPRQDTEILVEEVLKFTKESMHVLDMCTGSGCIIISLMKYANHISGVGVDISREALEVAKKNAENHCFNVKFINSNLFENIEGKFDMIVSNPPYIPTGDIKNLKYEVKAYDPLLALDGKEDGLYFYTKIIEESVHYLKKNGLLFLEIGYNQGEKVKHLMLEHKFKEIKIVKDLTGLNRVIYGRT